MHGNFRFPPRAPTHRSHRTLNMTHLFRQSLCHVEASFAQSRLLSSRIPRDATPMLTRLLSSRIPRVWTIPVDEYYEYNRTITRIRETWRELWTRKDSKDAMAPRVHVHLPLERRDVPGRDYTGVVPGRRRVLCPRPRGVRRPASGVRRPASGVRRPASAPAPAPAPAEPGALGPSGNLSSSCKGNARIREGRRNRLPHLVRTPGRATIARLPNDVADMSLGLRWGEDASWKCRSAFLLVEQSFVFRRNHHHG